LGPFRKHDSEESSYIMDTTNLTAIISLLVALSVASERLVEIVKGLVPALNQENPDPKKEGWRKAFLQILAVAAGIITAFFASPAVPGNIFHGVAGNLALGLLASGGSGFWNSLLTYANKAKEVKSAEAESKKIDNVTKRVALARAQASPPPR
jgi:hypothetical protein